MCETTEVNGFNLVNDKIKLVISTTKAKSFHNNNIIIITYFI